MTGERAVTKESTSPVDKVRRRGSEHGGENEVEAEKKGSCPREKFGWHNVTEISSYSSIHLAVVLYRHTLSMQTDYKRGSKDIALETTMLK